jgi:DNA (cytosine-5)-methyltransferase 1
MRHGSLFSGIGGFDLASEWMGWENVFHCEWNEFGQKVLKYYWPKAITYNDITKTDFTIHRGSIDILTGGFPCQPYSSAGKRLGKEDERHLWPEMLRAIREIQPSYVVGENVRGLVNWNGGLVFDEVQSDLEAEGYEVTPFLLPACGVNAPHRRDRIWFVAFNPKSKRDTKVRRIWERKDNESIGICKENINASNSNLYGCDECNCNNEVNTSKGRINAFGNPNKSDGNGNATNSNVIGLRKQSDRIGKSRLTNKKSKGNNWQNFPTVSPICDGDDGLSDRLDGITFSKWRNESIKAGGNAVVTHLVHQIFKAINQYNQLNNQLTL